MPFSQALLLIRPYHQRHAASDSVQLSSEIRPRAEQVPLADPRSWQLLKHKRLDKDEKQHLELHEGQLVSDTPARTVDKRHDVGPDPGAGWIRRRVVREPPSRVECARTRPPEWTGHVEVFDRDVYLRLSAGHLGMYSSVSYNLALADLDVG